MIFLFIFVEVSQLYRKMSEIKDVEVKQAEAKLETKLVTRCAIFSGKTGFTVEKKDLVFKMSKIHRIDIDYASVDVDGATNDYYQSMMSIYCKELSKSTMGLIRPSRVGDSKGNKSKIYRDKVGFFIVYDSPIDFPQSLTFHAWSCGKDGIISSSLTNMAVQMRFTGEP